MGLDASSFISLKQQVGSVLIGSLVKSLFGLDNSFRLLWISMLMASLRSSAKVELIWLQFRLCCIVKVFFFTFKYVWFLPPGMSDSCLWFLSDFSFFSLVLLINPFYCRMD